MAGIEWSEKISVDGGVIDADHKHLIMISNLFLTSGPGTTHESLCEIIDDLEHYATAHFQREEDIQHAIEFQGHARQKAEHADLLNSLALIGEQIRTCPLAEIDRARQEIASLIRHWLIDHILKSDIEMKPYRDMMTLNSGGLVPLSNERHQSNRIISTSKAKSLSIDGGVIDEDHRRLTDLINSFIIYENDCAKPERLKEIVKALHDYANIHFRREEDLQVAVGFPYQDAHKKAHRDLLKELQALGSDLIRTHASTRHGAFSTFLRRWLVDHVQEVDVRMKPYVDEMRRMRSGGCMAPRR